MSIGRLRTLLILVGIAFVGLTAWSLRFFSRYQPLATLSSGYAQPDLGQIGLQAHDVIVVGSEAGRRRWRMTAGVVTFSRDRRSLVVDDIRQGLFYDAHARPLISLTARHAMYLTPLGSVGFGYATAGTLRLDHGVKAAILNSERPTLQTQSLQWDSLRNQILSPGALTVTLPKMTVTAGSATYDLPVGGITAATRGTLHLNGGIHAALPRLTVSAGSASYTPAINPVTASAPFGSETDAARGTLSLWGGIHAVVQSAHGPISLGCPGLIWNGDKSEARSLGLVTAQIPGGMGETTASDAQVDTRTGNLIVRGVQGTMRLSPGVQ